MSELQNKKYPSLSRRSFLRNSSALAAAPLLASQAQTVDSAPRKVRIGVAGGRFGSQFQWHEHPDCVVAAVSDLRPDRLEHLMKTYKCQKTYPCLEEMVKDKNLDAIAVYTPLPDHARHAVLAMNHGKHVISAVAPFYTLDEAELMLETIKKTGQTYMLSETSYFQQHTISARKFYQQKKYGDLYYCESEYQHDGLDSLFFENGKPTWRHGFPPMQYPTHCTSHLISVTGERLTEVACHGWGDDDPMLKNNPYNNPFWNESAMFKTDRGNAFRVNVWWKGAHRGCERAQWIGSKMSFYCDHPNGVGATIIRRGKQTEKDDAGFVRNLPNHEKYDQPQWWKTDMLPEPMRHNSGHHGSHTFLTNEFIDAITHDRQPAIDIYEAIAYMAPGIMAHQSALKGGELLKIPTYDPPKK
jgi:predicted dehydrogenase